MVLIELYFFCTCVTHNFKLTNIKLVTVGRNYAAKTMHGKSDLRPFMNNELDILNVLNHPKIIRLHDALETSRSLTLITELYPLFIKKKMLWNL